MDMPWYEHSLTRLERRLREMIEGDPAADGFPKKLHRQLENSLLTAMRSGMSSIPGGKSQKGTKLIAPNQYTLVLPPHQAQQLLSHPTELERLEQRLKSSATQAGILFASEPILRVVASPDPVEMKVQVDYCHEQAENSHTTEMARALDHSGLMNPLPLPKAFLIVNGLKTCPLTTTVINIGRDASNQIQLDDPRVSRLHAQLRFIQGRFVIFDLDSTGGTFVNNIAVSNHILSPGDVIQLAGVPLVYGQDQDVPSSFTQEMTLASPPPEVL
jgi:hypothetical protein